MQLRAYVSIVLLLLIPTILDAQSQIQEKESRLRTASGFEKLELLNELVDLYESSQIKKAQRYAKQADDLANSLITEDGLSDREIALAAESKIKYGRIQYQRESYVGAKETFTKSLLASERLAYDQGISESNKYLNKIDSLASLGFVKEGLFDKVDIGSAISNSPNSMATATELKMAQMAEKQGDVKQAIVHYEKAVKLLISRGEYTKAKEIESKITGFEEARKLDSLRKEIEAQPDSTTEIISRGISYDSSRVVMRLPETVVMRNKQEQEELSDLKERAETLEREGDIAASLAAYKAYTELKEKWQRDSAAISLAEIDLERLRKQNEIADLNIAAIQKEKEAEVRLKNFLTVIAAIVGLSLIFIFFLYLSKRRKHRQLSEAYVDLDEAKNKLEEAEQHISKLLEQQVSPEIAEALIEEKPQREKQFVAVMFLDIRGFTPMAEKMDPAELIEYQNQVFGFMIEIIRERHGNINQFMGDGFMSTFGAPVSHGNDVRNAYLAAIDILEEIKQLNDTKKIPHTSLGIGIHAGYVVTGNVGTDSRKQFSVTGNTVIVAARVEQLNKKYHSQLIITEDVFDALEDGDVPEIPEFEEVNVKGRSHPVKILKLYPMEDVSVS